MKNTYKRSIIHVASIATAAFPIVVYGAVTATCDGPNCGFNDLLDLGNNIVKFLMFDVSIPLATIGFIFSGAKLIINQNKEGAWNEAKESFGNILIGFGIMLGAYVLIKVILFNFINTNAGFYLFLLQ